MIGAGVFFGSVLHACGRRLNMASPDLWYHSKVSKPILPHRAQPRAFPLLHTSFREINDKWVGSFFSFFFFWNFGNQIFAHYLQNRESKRKSKTRHELKHTSTVQCEKNAPLNPESLRL